MMSGTLQSRGHAPRSVVLAHALLSVVLMASGCKERDLRGKETKSTDGKTYLVVDDDCGSPVYLDGSRWPHATHVAGEVSPGQHEIACGAGARGSGAWFRVKPGTTFHFDYWGP